VTQRYIESKLPIEQIHMAGRVRDPSQEHQMPSECWCPSYQVVFADLSAAIDAGVLSVLVVEHLLRCASSTATARTPIPLCSLRGLVDAAFGAVTREGEIAQVGVRCWVSGQQLRWFKTTGEYTSIFPNPSISSILYYSRV
jgi:hypothetical protein